MNPDVLEYIRDDASTLHSWYEKSKRLGEGSPVEVSDYREAIFKSVLKKYFPTSLAMAKGIIRDKSGLKSPSIDAVMLNASHPNTAGVEGKHDLILAEAVDFAIEIKPNLSRKDEIHRGLKQIQKLKQLRRSVSIFPSFRDPEAAHVAELGKYIPAIIWGEESFDSLEKLSNVIEEYYRSKNVPFLEQVDFVFVNKLGIIVIAKHGRQGIVKTDNPGVHLEEYGDDALAALIKKLALKVLPAGQLLDHPVIHHYLEGLSPSKVLAADSWPGLNADSQPNETSQQNA